MRKRRCARATSRTSTYPNVRMSKTRGKETYKIVKWESQLLIIFIFPIEKVVTSKRARFIHMVRPINGLKHRIDSKLVAKVFRDVFR